MAFATVLAKLNTDSLCLVRASEQVVFPLIGDGIKAPKQVPQYGNFHVAPLDSNESWILSGEVIQSNFRGDLLLARVRVGKHSFSSKIQVSWYR